MEFKQGDIVRFKDKYGENLFGKVLTVLDGPQYQVLECHDGVAQKTIVVDDLKMMEVIFRAPWSDTVE